METLRLFVVRHGETRWSRELRFAGARDVGLTERGRLQAEAVARALADKLVALVYASPLERTRATAAVIAAPHRLEIQLEPAFREMAFGEWEGCTRTEIAARFPAAWAAWRATPHLVRPAGGESLGEVAGRVSAGVAELRDVHQGEAVVLVSHAIVIRLIVLEALGLGLDRLWSVDASPAGITEIEYHAEGGDGRGWTVVHRMNTLSHLEAVEAAAP